MGLSELDNTLGGLVAGTWVNSMLLMVEFLQVYKYFKYYPNDPPLLRCTVALLLLLSVECTIGNYANVYLYCVINWGNKAFLVNQYWPTPNYIVATAASAIIVQTFLIWRFWRLSKDLVVVAFLQLMSLAAFGGAIALTVEIARNSALAARPAAQTTATIWFVTSAATDVAIAIALIWAFCHMQTFFDSTRSLLRRLIRITVMSGTATSTVALTAFFLYLANKEANWAVGVVFMLGPVYSLTMLANLNSRRRLNGVGHTSDGVDELTGTSSGGGAIRRADNSEAFAMSGIHVIRTVQVNDDQNRKLDTRSFSDRHNEVDLESFEDRKRRSLGHPDPHTSTV